MPAAIRFLHAADLHLEGAFRGLADAPTAVRDRLLEAPFLAAQRVFETALAENVDFVLLCGDVLRPRDAGPRALKLLQKHFDRLGAAGVRIFWVGGAVDPPGSWPETLPLPEHVTVLPGERVGVESFSTREGGFVRLIGRSGDGQPVKREAFERMAGKPGGKGDEAIIVAAHGPLASDPPPETHIAYWALGGAHRRATPVRGRVAVHDSGTTQARSFAETGQHGVTLVTLDGVSKPQLKFLPVDDVRVFGETLELAPTLTRRELRRHIDDRMSAQAATAGNRLCVARWRLSASPDLAPALRRHHLTDQLLTELRQAFNRGDTKVWTAEVALHAPRQMPADWREEDSFRGDFLRSMAERKLSELLAGRRGLIAAEAESDQTESASAAEGDEFAHLPADVRRLIQRRMSSHPRDLKRNAALLGADLLSGDADYSHAAPLTHATGYQEAAS